MSLFPASNLPDETIIQTIIHLPSSKFDISGNSDLTAQFQFHLCWNFIRLHSKNNVLTAICIFWIMSCGLCSYQIYNDHVAQVISCWLEVLFIPKPVSVWFWWEEWHWDTFLSKYCNFLQYHSTMLSCHSVSDTT